MNKNNRQTKSTARREELLQRFEHFTEFPLIILAFLMIPLILGPFLWDLQPRTERAFLLADYLIWAVFLVDLVVKAAISPRRGAYLKRHWLDVLVVVVPFFRPLRIFRVFLYTSRAWVGLRRLVKLDFLLIYGLGLVIIAATVVATVEQNAGGTINGFADALWWAVVTVTTVGYGDEVPVTLAGRAVAFVLMLGGIAFFSGVTANLASFMIRGRERDSENISELLHEVKQLREEIASLRPGNGV